MIFRILAGLIFFIHAGLSILLIFGMSFGVGLGEVSKDSARTFSLLLLSYAAVFGLTGVALMFPYKITYFVGMALLSLTIFYFLWLMLTAQGQLLYQAVVLVFELTSIVFLIWTYRTNFLNSN